MRWRRNDLKSAKTNRAHFLISFSCVLKQIKRRTTSIKGIIDCTRRTREIINDSTPLTKHHHSCYSPFFLSFGFFLTHTHCYSSLSDIKLIFEYQKHRFALFLSTSIRSTAHVHTLPASKQDQSKFPLIQ